MIKKMKEKRFKWSKKSVFLLLLFFITIPFLQQVKVKAEEYEFSKYLVGNDFVVANDPFRLIIEDQNENSNYLNRYEKEAYILPTSIDTMVIDSYIGSGLLAHYTFSDYLFLNISDMFIQGTADEGESDTDFYDCIQYPELLFTLPMFLSGGYRFTNYFRFQILTLKYISGSTSFTKVNFTFQEKINGASEFSNVVLLNPVPNIYIQGTNDFSVFNFPLELQFHAYINSNTVYWYLYGIFAGAPNDDHITIRGEGNFINGMSCDSLYLYTEYRIKRLTMDNVDYTRVCLDKSRMLKGTTSDTFIRIFKELPLIYENEFLELDVDDTDETGEDKPREPNLPYWSYDTFTLEHDENTSTEIGNWTLYYQTFKGKKQTEKYYYNPEVVKPLSLGDWKFKIVAVKVNFNSVRNALVGIVNTLLLLGQFILYLLLLAFNWLFLFLLMYYVVPFLWNFVIYYLVVGLLWIVWIIWLALLMLYYYVLLPLFNWFVNDFLPILVDILILVFSFILAIILWIISMGTADFWVLQQNISDMMYTIADFFIDSMNYFLEHIEVFFAWLFVYIVLIFLGYIKYVYVRARGYNNRAKKLKTSITIYAFPIKVVYELIKKILTLLGKGGGSKEQDDQ